MGDLWRFTWMEEREARELERPPKDPLARAEWLHSSLCEELRDVFLDGGLSDEERREWIVKLAGKIVSATPNSELHAARSALRDKEKDKAQALPGGAVKHGQVSQSGSLRSSAPKRGRKPRSS